MSIRAELQLTGDSISECLLLSLKRLVLACELRSEVSLLLLVRRIFKSLEAIVVLQFKAKSYADMKVRAFQHMILVCMA